MAGGANVLLRTGIGLTVTTTFCPGELLQRLAVVMYTYVTLIGAAVVFVNISLTFPAPAEAACVIPATRALLHANVDPVVALVAV